MNLREIICLVLGGGRGTRLDPLTRYRSKPAVPVGGKFRLVDIPISNSLNSGIERIFVLTQFNSASLNSHISQTFQFSLFSDGFVQTLAAEQTTDSRDWYQGTADAVRRSLTHLRDSQPKHVLILSGDQLYRMDFAPMIQRHVERDAEITIAVHPISSERASAFGLAKLDGNGRVESFLEKPQDPKLLQGYEMPEGRPEEESSPSYAASMGIYLFKYDVLKSELEDGNLMDFGHEILPRAVGSRHVDSHVFTNYWEDIGTIRAFYKASLDLARSDAPFVFYSKGAPIYTRPRFLGASRIHNCQIRESMLCDGCYMHGSRIENSVISIRSIVERGSVLKKTVLMGADAYEGDMESSPGAPPLGVGPECHIEGAIIDKNARIGSGVRIRPRAAGTNEDHSNYVVRDGIVVIPKHTILPDGTEI